MVPKVVVADVQRRFSSAAARAREGRVQVGALASSESRRAPLLPPPAKSGQFCTDRCCQWEHAERDYGSRHKAPHSEEGIIV
jgi:hypothetical protein